ncbi:MAG TPA: hypothetical protein ENJ88_09285 [Phaeodactylibacter sp.]|nr:hypothetical protein [Phaeodactylibacter sp.]
MKQKLLLAFALCVFLSGLQAQELIYKTFKDTRIINTHSIETPGARKLDFRVTHRFGDMLGSNGGWSNFFGLENASDISIGLEYGISDRLMLGLSRAKGSSVSDRKQLVNGLIKYRILRQMTEEAPLSLTFAGGSSLSTMPKVEGSEGINAFPKFSHRFAFFGQLLLARKFSEKLTFQLSATVVHRNLVRDEESNDTYAVGLAGRIQANKVVALIFDSQLPLNGYASPFNNNSHFPSFGIGAEFDTGGHVFQINLTNSNGIMETDYLPNTTANWAKGQFRLGFTISRLFNL